MGSSSVRILGRSKTSDLKGVGRSTESERSHKDINLRVVDRLRPSSRPIKAVPGNRTNVINNAGKVGDTHIHGTGTVSSPHVAHRTYPHSVRYAHRNEHIYWDYHNRLCHRIVWPRYRFPVSYGYGPRFTFRYVYPYHLRRYVFVSLGGYWPVGYSYIRYYWYGCHPYRWYGYYPIAHEVQGDTYNYYTYNYYSDDVDTTASESSRAVGIIEPVDHDTFADIREKLAQQEAEVPDQETPADRFFDEAVKVFEAGNYDMSIDKFAEAMKLAPDDMILPFAYSQSLFANEQYSQAANVLREALAKVSPEKEGVFYPRGLYSDDDILFEQIERLTQKAELYSFNADLQLLLGYQLLGVGELDKAVEPLQSASQDLENAAAAKILLDLLEKIKTDTETQNTN